MAVATKEKKTTARKPRANPPEYTAFVERGRTLTEKQAHPFHHALRRLRRALNDPLEFERFVLEGVHEIVLITEELRSRQFRGHFPPIQTGVGGRKLKHPRLNPLAVWVADRMNMNERGVKEYRGFMSITAPVGKREEEVREKFALLRDTLNNPKSYRALVEIGPCALSVWNPHATMRDPDGHQAIPISNFIPDCMPNADFSIVPIGARPEASNGIWFHS